MWDGIAVDMYSICIVSTVRILLAFRFNFQTLGYSEGTFLQLVVLNTTRLVVNLTLLSLHCAIKCKFRNHLYWAWFYNLFWARARWDLSRYTVSGQYIMHIAGSPFQFSDSWMLRHFYSWWCYTPLNLLLWPGMSLVHSLVFFRAGKGILNEIRNFSTYYRWYF